MSNCIRAVKLSKTYHRAEVVRSIDFEVKQGQLFAFLGPNGAGKSTTMNMLCTLLQKSDGKIFIDGLDMDHNRKEIKNKIGVVFQEDVLDRELTVEQNLLCRGSLYLSGRRTLTRRVEEVAGLLQIKELLPKKYAECSGGQRRTVQIGRALLSGPRLLILDEPTTGLDPVARRQVWQTLLRLRQECGMTVFYATHYMEEASYADRVCFISGGNVLLCDDMRHIREGSGAQAMPTLEKLYFRLLEEGEP